MPITNIVTGATKKIRITVKVDGVVTDISSDTVTYMLKTNETDTDANALIDQDADVASQGALGIADITLAKTTTDDLTVGKKYFEIILVRNNGEEYVLKSGSVYVVGRITDII